MSTLSGEAITDSIFGKRDAVRIINGLCSNCGARTVGGFLLCPCGTGGVRSRVPAIETDSHKSLKKKQDYYRYDARPWRFKDAPVLDRALVDVMKAERLDRVYRFVWGGVVIVREEENSKILTIARGDKNACHYVKDEKTGDMVLLPKYAFGRAMQARGYYYIDDLGRKICTKREELIPAEYTSRIDMRYVDFGQLHWYLEARITGEDLVNSRVYNKDEAVPESEWICLMPLKAKNGLYYEPGLEMIEVMQQREAENRNGDMNKIAEAGIERDERARIAREKADDAAGKKEFNAIFDDVMKFVERKPTTTT